MPNWCDNALTLTNSDKSKIDAVSLALVGSTKGLFETLRPNPKGEWEYDWSISNWGTKWDADIIDWERHDDNTIWVSMNTAWSPPTALYQYLVDNGWGVEAVYYEPGMAYGGIFTTEDGDDYYELDWTSREDIENLPEELIQFGDLLTQFDEYEVERLREDWEDADRTEWFSMDVVPQYEGYYEIEIKNYDDTSRVEFAKFVNSEWDWWNTDRLLCWRGLAKDPNEKEVG